MPIGSGVPQASSGSSGISAFTPQSISYERLSNRMERLRTTNANSIGKNRGTSVDAYKPIVSGNNSSQRGNLNANTITVSNGNSGSFAGTINAISSNTSNQNTMASMNRSHSHLGLLNQISSTINTVTSINPSASISSSINSLLSPQSNIRAVGIKRGVGVTTNRNNKEHGTTYQDSRFDGVQNRNSDGVQHRKSISSKGPSMNVPVITPQASKYSQKILQDSGSLAKQFQAINIESHLNPLSRSRSRSPAKANNNSLSRSRSRSRSQSRKNSHHEAPHHKVNQMHAPLSSKGVYRRRVVVDENIVKESGAVYNKTHESHKMDSHESLGRFKQQNGYHSIPVYPVRLVPGRMYSKQELETIVRDQMAYRDQMVYRGEIVYKNQMAYKDTNANNGL